MYSLQFQWSLWLKMTDIREQYITYIKEYIPLHGIHGAKKLARDSVLNSLFAMLEDEQLSQDKKLDTIVSILKMMRE